MSEPPDLQQLTALREILTARFNDQELRTLCFDLGVSYDDLAGEGKAGKARELVDHLKRRESIPQLIEVGRRQRPDIPWPELTPDQRSIAAGWAAARDEYDAQIIKQYGQIRIFGQTTPKSLREIFTDAYVLDRPTAMRRFDPEAVRDHLWNKDRSAPWRAGERLPAEELLSREDKFFIFGRPGAGKTTFLKRLAVREAQRGAWGPCLGKMPIFVSLKQFAETKKSLLDFIVDQFAICHFPDAKPFVEALLKSGQALVLFDGLDEVTKAAEAADDQRGQVTQMIDQFARQYDGCHVVITCRIAATEYAFPPPFIYLEMADFAPEQVEKFVRGWFWDAEAPDESTALAERMLAEWRRPEHVGIRDLGRNPLLLTLLCLNYAETLSFPPGRAELYDEALQALLKKWDVSRRIERAGVYKGLSVGRKQQMFARIAYDGFVQGEIVFAQEDLEARLKAYLVHVPGMPESIDIDGEVVLREIIEQHGLFAEQSRGLFSFAHLTFQEFYTAQYIKESAAPDALDALLARLADDKWREVFLLTADMLQDATPFLVAFEGALHRLATSRLQVTAWLRGIDEQAGRSQAGYRRPATRAFYALGLDLELALNLARVREIEVDVEHEDEVAFDFGLEIVFAQEFARDLALDRDVDLALELILARGFALDLACDLEVDLARDLALTQALARARDPGSDSARARDGLLQLCRQQGRTALFEAIFALELSDEKASSLAWRRNASVLEHVIEAQGDLARCRQLEAESTAVARTYQERLMLNSEDLERLVIYAKASRLFYDCLQVAYVPDRRGFEERIFWVPE